MGIFAFLIWRALDLVLRKEDRRASANVLIATTVIPVITSIGMGYIAATELHAACKICIGHLRQLRGRTDRLDSLSLPSREARQRVGRRRDQSLADGGVAAARVRGPARCALPEPRARLLALPGHLRGAARAGRSLRNHDLPRRRRQCGAGHRDLRSAVPGLSRVRAAPRRVRGSVAAASQGGPVSRSTAPATGWSRARCIRARARSARRSSAPIRSTSPPPR